MYTIKRQYRLSKVYPFLVYRQNHPKHLDKQKTIWLDRAVLTRTWTFGWMQLSSLLLIKQAAKYKLFQICQKMTINIYKLLKCKRF